MTSKNTWKKIAAGAMSLTIIAGQTVLPAGLGGLFTGGTALVASAEDQYELEDITFDKAWTSTDSLPTEAGNYYLTGDVTISSRPATTYNGNINIYLNDHCITSTGTNGLITLNEVSNSVSGFYGGTSTTGDANKIKITNPNASISYMSGEYQKLTFYGVTIETAGKGVQLNGSRTNSKCILKNTKLIYTGSDKRVGVDCGNGYRFEMNNCEIQGFTSSMSISEPGSVVCITGDSYADGIIEIHTASPSKIEFQNNAVLSGTHPVLSKKWVSGSGWVPNTPSKDSNIEFTVGETETVFTAVENDANYTVGKNANGVWQFMYVTPASVTEAPKAKELKYNGEAQELVTGGEAKDGTMQYKLGEDGTYSENIPTGTEIGKYKVYYKAVSDYGDSEEGSVDVTIGIGTAKVTVPDDAVIEGQEATDGIYTLECGKTYNIYSDETLNPSDAAGLDISTANDKEYDGKTYNYKYTVTFADTIADGTEYEFAHKHAAKAFSTDADHPDTDKVWVYCEGEPSENAGCVAYLDTDGTYYYGDAPTIADVKLSDYFDATADVTDFFFTKKGDLSGTKVSPENMEIGTTYIVNATIAVTIDNKVSNFAITREIVFAARPLKMCDAYLVEGENETKLDIVDGVITVPADKFTYTGEEQAPVIVIKNNILGTETALTEADYTDSIEAKTNAGDYTAKLTATTGEGTKYTGELTVNWNINKADAEVTAEALDNIVYDGEVLDKTDFNFTDEQGVLESEGAKISVTGTDITNAGRHTATITITSDNYNDIMLDVPATIARRPVTLTPDAEQKMTFGETEIPAIKYTVEKQNDETKTGFIATDAENASEFFGSVVKLGKEIETTNVLKPELDNDFDYGEFKNDAGTYTFIVDETAGQTTTAGYDNYIPVVAKDAYFTVVPKNIASEDVVVTLEGTSDDFTYEDNKPVVTYDGKTKKVTVESVTDGETLLTNNADYTIGGTLQKVYPGEFNVQISGQGNYTGIAYAGWTVKGMDGAASIATVNNGIKTYDGEDVSGLFTVDLGNIPKSKATVKTEYYEGETKLDAAPVNAGSYTVKVKITAKGYTTQNLEADLIIEKADVTVTGTLDKNDIIYSDAAPQVISYEFDGVLDAEKADFEANTTVDWTLDEATNTYNGVVNTTDEYNNNYNFTVVSPVYNITPKDIESNDIKVIYTSKTKLTNDWTECNDITVIDTKTGQPLVEGVDYTINGNTSKVLGNFTIEIIGINHYTGIKELPWTVVETAEEAAVATVASYKTYDDEGRITFALTNTYNGTKDVQYGYLVYRGAEDIGDMTLQMATERNAAHPDLKDTERIATGEYKNSTTTLRAKDNGNGVYVRPYIVVDGNIMYGEQVYVEFDALKEHEAIEAAHSEIIDAQRYDDKDHIVFSADFSYTGETAAQYGILVYRNDATGLTLTADTEGVTNSPCSHATTTFRAKDNGNGVTVRTYILIDGEYHYGAQRTYYYSKLAY